MTGFIFDDFDWHNVKTSLNETEKFRAERFIGEEDETGRPLNKEEVIQVLNSHGFDYGVNNVEGYELDFHLARSGLYMRLGDRLSEDMVEKMDQYEVGRYEALRDLLDDDYSLDQMGLEEFA